MKPKIIMAFTIMMLFLTACVKKENTESRLPLTTQISLESADTLISELKEEHENTVQSKVVPSLVKVDENTFTFEDMEYVVMVVKAEILDSEDSPEMLFEHALLGGVWNTYDKGRECYLTVNTLYEVKQEQEYEDKEWDRRHIFCFTNDGETVLIKNYAHPFSIPREYILYEIYNNSKPAGSYIYHDILRMSEVNYTKGLKYVNVNDGYMKMNGGGMDFAMPDGSLKDGGVLNFYRTSQLSTEVSGNMEKHEISREIANATEMTTYVTESELYEVSRVTNPTDTMYYKEDSDRNGKECIGIYSVDSKELIYQSKAFEQGIEIEENLEKVMLLNDMVIVGITASDVNKGRLEYDDYYSRNTVLDYYEIDLKSGNWMYLFTDIQGDFSPDGKYFAAACVPSGYNNEYYPGGYHIVCLETGEYINIAGYVPTSEIDEYVYKTDIVCWVNKDKIDELLELTMK